MYLKFKLFKKLNLSTQNTEKKQAHTGRMHNRPPSDGGGGGWIC